MRHSLRIPAVGGALAVTLAASMATPALAGPTFTFVHENDWMFNQDRDYSSGVRLDYVSGESRPGDGLTGGIARRLLGADESSMVRTGFSLNHLMFVPEDTSSPGVPEGQHPYAGYLGGEYAVFEQRDNVLEKVSFSIGIIGPEAGAEELQDYFHEIFDDDEAQGWDSQLGTEVGVSATYDRAQKFLDWDGPGPTGADVIVHGSGTLGNTLIQGTVGSTVRIGTDLQDDFLPPRMYPFSGAGFWENTSIASAYVFAGYEARLVAHNIFLDGSTFEDSPGVDRNIIVGDFFAGAAAQFWVGQVSFTYQQRGREYETQEVPQKIGSIALSVNF